MTPTRIDEVSDRKHPLAGKTVTLKLRTEPYENLKDGAKFHVEDWANRVFGQPWGYMQGNPTALIYAMRAGFGGIETDNKVIYGKVDSLAYLVHESEIEG